MRATTIAICATATLFLGIARAEDATSPPKKPAEETVSPLKEVVVTAQKRAENVQDVPLSISAITGNELSQSDVFDMSRLDTLVPGMKFGQSGNDARPAIRGTRTQNVIGNADPVVAYYVDGVYRSRPGEALATFVDVKRVEVLRGPQGTLFGRNSFGGAVNVISNPPDPSGVHLGLDLTAENYDGLRTEGFVNLPVNGTSALRFSAYDDKQNGWVKNVINPQNSLHDKDDQFVRAQYLLRPSSRFSLTLRAEFWHGGGNGPGDFGYYVPGIPIDPSTGKTNGVTGILRRTISYDPTGAVQGGIGGPGFAGSLYPGTPADADPFHIARNFPAERRVNQRAFSADMAVGLGELADLHTILSYTNYSEYRQADADFSAQPLLYNFNRVTAKTYTEEFQLISRSVKPLSWVVGAFLLQDRPTDFYVYGTDGTGPPQGTVTYPAQLFAPAFYVANPYAVDPNLYIQGPYRLRTNSQAAYADGTYSITDTFRLIAGVRYTRDDKSGEYDNPDYIYDNAPPTTAQRTFSRTTWRGGMQYDVASRSMLYATVSTGFQSGGFNGTPTLLPFDQTTVIAYEIGSKSILFDGHLRANLALYHNSYTNLLSQTLVQIGSAIQSRQSNAGAVKARGAEVELDWYPTDLAYIGFRGSYNHSRFGSFITSNSFQEGGNLPNGGFQLEGQQVPLNPTVTATLMSSYDLRTGAAGTFTPEVDLFHSSSYRTSDQPYFFANQGAYTAIDFHLRWHPSNEASGISAEIFCENCSDRTILLRTTPNSGSVVYQDFAPPRMYGARLNYRY